MVTLDLSGWPMWRYTVSNTRTGQDPQWITLFKLDLEYDVTNVQAPLHWKVETDYKSYAIWKNVDRHPYGNEIRPNTSLSGFDFRSSGDWRCGAYILVHRDHQNNAAGPAKSDWVRIPTIPGPTPPRAISPSQTCPELTGRDHFYTIYAAERDDAIAKYAYVSEGWACHVYAQAASGTTPLYRLRSVRVTDHFYTIYAGERDDAIANHGYVSEGVACHVLAQPATGTTPMYRLYHTQGEHFYTIWEAERDEARARGYTLEGVGFHVFAEPATGRTLLYRLLLTR